MTLEDKIYTIAEKLGSDKLKIQSFLRSTSYETLVPLLYYWPEVFNDLLYPNMSKRARDLILDDIPETKKPTLQETEIAAEAALKIFVDPIYIIDLEKSYEIADMF